MESSSASPEISNFGLRAIFQSRGNASDPLILAYAITSERKLRPTPESGPPLSSESKIDSMAGTELAPFLISNFVAAQSSSPFLSTPHLKTMPIPGGIGQPDW